MAVTAVCEAESPVSSQQDGPEPKKKPQPPKPPEFGTRRHPKSIAPGTDRPAIPEEARESIYKAAIETLEGRQYMSASIGLVNHVLTVRADASTSSHMSVGLTHGGKDIAAHVTGAPTQQFPIADVQSIEIFGSSGNDHIIVGRNIMLPSTIDGGEGNDTIFGGGGADHITAGDGNNRINGRGGSDMLTVGSGHDVVWGGAGSDTLYGGAGFDMLYAGGHGNKTIDAGTGHTYVLAPVGMNNIVRGPNTRVVASRDSTVVNAPKPAIGSGNASTTSGSTSGATSTGTAGSSTSTGGSNTSTSGSSTGSSKGTSGSSTGTTGASGSSTGTSGSTTSTSGSSTGTSKGTGGSSTGTTTSGSSTGTSGSTTSTSGSSTGTSKGTSGSSTGTTGTSGSSSSTSGSTTTASGTSKGTSGSSTSTTGTSGSSTSTSGSTTSTSGSTTGTSKGATGSSTGSTGTSGSSATTSGSTTSTTGSSTGTTKGTSGTTSSSTGTSGSTTAGGSSNSANGSSTPTGGSTTGTGTSTTATPTSGSAPAWATQTTLGSANPGNISFSAAKTQANIQVQDATGMATHTVHFNGLGSKFASGDALDATYTWNFGDPGSPFNTLTGWIGAHTYDTPGTYTASLTVTDKAGNSSTVTTQVTIAASTRRSIYVDSVAGNDANTGASAQFAVATVARAMQLLGNDTQILFHNGQTFQVVNSCAVVSSNVLVSTYGSGTPAVLEKVKGTGASIFNIGASATNFTAQGIVLDSMWTLATYGTGKVDVYGFMVTGDNFTCRNCIFHNVDDGVNTSGEPTGVLIQNNYFGMEIRGCSIWAQGYDHVYIGNTFTNSTKEHLIRSSGTGTQRLLIEDNNFSRPTQNKGSLELRTASFFYVTGNTVDGGTVRLGLPMGVDPYFSGWGVFQDNHTSKIFVNIRPGLQHVVLRNNVFDYDQPGSVIVVEPVGTVGDPPVIDIRIDHNTLVDTAAHGNLLSLLGPATNISVTNNLVIDPNESWNGVGSGGIFVTGTDLSSFSEISNNVWPLQPANSSQKGANFIGPAFDTTAGFVNNSAWNQLKQVENDQFANVDLPADVYDITLNGTTAGAMPGFFNPNSWSVAAKAAA